MGSQPNSSWHFAMGNDEVLKNELRIAHFYCNDFSPKGGVRGYVWVWSNRNYVYPSFGTSDLTLQE